MRILCSSRLFVVFLFLTQFLISRHCEAQSNFTLKITVKELAFFTGFGYGIDNNSLPEGNYSPVHFIGHMGYKSLFLKNDSVVGKQDFLLFVEPSYNHVFIKAPNATIQEWDAGIMPGIKYYYKLLPKLTLSLYIGSGPHWYSATTSRQAPGFIFANVVGLGLQASITNKLALAASFRIRHMSNADTRQPNHGINTNNHVIGLIYKID